MMNSANAMTKTTFNESFDRHHGVTRSLWMRRLVATTLMSGSALLSPWQAEAANIAQDVSDRVELAQSISVILDIPAQSLDRALTSLADQANLKLFFPSQGLADIDVPALQGEMPVEAALGALLKGSGYTWRYTDGGIITIEKLSASEESVLDPIRVEANAQFETADSPVEGYIAQRSRTATKTDTPLLETARSVSVVTSGILEEQAATTVEQALNYTAGTFTGYAGASNRYDYVIVRGQPDRSITNIALDGLSLLNDDGTYSSMQIDPYFIDRIDVLKGPASVLYGQNPAGGLVALSSKRPEYTQSGEAYLAYGSRDHLEGGVDVTGPVGESGIVAYRITAKGKTAKTQFEDVKEERYAVSPQITAEFTENTRLTVSAYLQNDPDGGVHHGLPAEGTLYPRNGQYISNSFFDGEPGEETFKRQQIMLGYELEHDINDIWSVRQNFRYIHSDVDVAQIYQVGWNGTTNELNRNFTGADEELNGFAIDNQAQVNFNTGFLSHDLLMGIDYQDRKTRTDWFFGSIPSLNAFNPVYGNSSLTGRSDSQETRYMDQTGLYIQDQVELHNWRFSFGLRQDWLNTSKLNRLTDTTVSENYSDLTKQAGVLYKFNNGVAPYFSYSEAFTPSVYTDAAGNLLRPTSSQQFEVGVKYQPEGYDLLLTGALYHLKEEDVATRVPGVQYNRPAGTRKNNGIELEAISQLTDNISVMANYSYNDSEYTETVDPNLMRKTPTRTPDHMASVWLHYMFDHGSLSGLKLGGGARYVGESWADEDNTIKVPSYTLFDLALTYDLDKVGLDNAALQLNVNNLMDEEYVSACQSATYCYFGEERTVLATMKYRF